MLHCFCCPSVLTVRRLQSQDSPDLFELGLDLIATRLIRPVAPVEEDFFGSAPPSSPSPIALFLEIIACAAVAHSWVRRRRRIVG